MKLIAVFINTLPHFDDEGRDISGCLCTSFSVASSAPIFLLFCLSFNSFFIPLVALHTHRIEGMPLSLSDDDEYLYCWLDGSIA